MGKKKKPRSAWPHPNKRPAPTSETELHAQIRDAIQKVGRAASQYDGIVAAIAIMAYSGAMKKSLLDMIPPEQASEIQTTVDYYVDLDLLETVLVPHKEP